MAVKDLQARQGNVEVTLEITEKGDVREFEKFGKKGRVCNAKGKDDSGSIVLTLWNDDIDKVNAGDTVKIENGWVSEWQGELQLGTGKFGKLEVVSKGSAQEAVTPDEQTESEVLEGQDSDKGEHILTEDEKVEEEVIEELDEEPSPSETISDDEKKE